MESFAMREYTHLSLRLLRIKWQKIEFQEVILCLQKLNEFFFDESIRSFGKCYDIFPIGLASEFEYSFVNLILLSKKNESLSWMNQQKDFSFLNYFSHVSLSVVTRRPKTNELKKQKIPEDDFTSDFCFFLFLWFLVLLVHRVELSVRR